MLRYISVSLPLKKATRTRVNLVYAKPLSRFPHVPRGLPTRRSVTSRGQFREGLPAWHDSPPS